MSGKLKMSCIQSIWGAEQVLKIGQNVCQLPIYSTWHYTVILNISFVRLGDEKTKYCIVIFEKIMSEFTKIFTQLWIISGYAYRRKDWSGETYNKIKR